MEVPAKNAVILGTSSPPILVVCTCLRYTISIGAVESNIRLSIGVDGAMPENRTG
jgi:hypothetical protein